MTTCIVQTPKSRVFESKELYFFKNSTCPPPCCQQSQFSLASFLYSDKRWSYSLTHIMPKTRNTSIFHLAQLTLDLTVNLGSTTLDLQSHNPDTKRNQHCDLGQFHLSTTASDLHIHNPNTKETSIVLD